MPHSISFSLDRKLVLFVMLVTVTAMIVTAFLSFSYAEQTLKDRAIDQLIGESSNRGNSIENIFETRITETQILATDPMIRSLVMELNENENNLKISELIDEKRRDFLIQIQAFQEIVGFSIGFEDVKIIGKNGMLYFSLGKTNNNIFINDPYFISGLAGTFIEFEPSDKNDKKMFIVIPIFAKDSTRNSEPIGVMITKMRTDALDKILLNRSGLGKTGEVYLVNKDHLMISESRFVENAMFSQRVDTLPVKECFNQQKEKNGFYHDYRQLMVYGSSFCFKETKLVLLAEIDESEVIGPIQILQNRILQTGIVITAIMAIIAFVLSKQLSKPLIKLKEAANEISEGNFDVITGINSTDEIGELSATFDSMAKKLQESILTIKEKEDVIKRQQKVLLQFSKQSENYCVCMVDIINSTGIAAKLSMEKSGEFYNIFINSMATLIEEYNGIVVKNIGDALLFYFPKTNTEDKKELLNSIECCLTMADYHDIINKKMEEAELPKFDYRISATYGTVRIARIATSTIDDIFGSTVNRCANINSFAPPNSLIIGSDLYELVASDTSFDYQMTKLSPLSDEHIYAVYVVKRKK